jgi:1-aminocyclopropane-1-carboxylate deaminase
LSIIKRSVNSYDVPDPEKAEIQTWDEPAFEKAGVGVDVLRLDKIHTIVSGNKWFKLKYYLAEVIQTGKKGIITLGGPYSNHLLATAFACRQSGFSSAGIVRGHKPAAYSQTLKDAQSFGMELQFISSENYTDSEFIKQIQQTYPDFLFVAEGGRGELGIKGAQEILHLVMSNRYSHVICAVGTGTMMTGIIKSCNRNQLVVGIPVWKLSHHHASTTYEPIGNNSDYNNFVLRYDYHFGGYAKKTTNLIHFMNRLFDQHQIPTDFVYTGKLFYATMDLIESGFFDPRSKILLVHSGGLQGNRSLPEGTLHFSY